MTDREFWAWICASCSHITLEGDIARFRYHDVEGTIDSRENCLNGQFKCYDDWAVRHCDSGPRIFFKYKSTNTK